MTELSSALLPLSGSPRQSPRVSASSGGQNTSHQLQREDRALNLAIRGIQCDSEMLLNEGEPT